MELPAMPVWSRSGSVRYSASMAGFKLFVNQSIVVLPRPDTESRQREKSQGEYSESRLWSSGLHSTATRISGIFVRVRYSLIPQLFP